MTYWWNTVTFPQLSMTTVIFHDFPHLENSFFKFHDSTGCVGTLGFAFKRLTSEISLCQLQGSQAVKLVETTHFIKMPR